MFLRTVQLSRSSRASVAETYSSWAEGSNWCGYLQKRLKFNMVAYIKDHQNNAKSIGACFQFKTSIFELPGFCQEAQPPAPYRGTDVICQACVGSLEPAEQTISQKTCASNVHSSFRQLHRWTCYTFTQNFKSLRDKILHLAALCSHLQKHCPRNSEAFYVTQCAEGEGRCAEEPICFEMESQSGVQQPRPWIVDPTSRWSWGISQYFQYMYFVCVCFFHTVEPLHRLQQLL